jgi:hypothetical protein
MGAYQEGKKPYNKGKEQWKERNNGRKGRKEQEGKRKEGRKTKGRKGERPEGIEGRNVPAKSALP